MSLIRETPCDFGDCPYIIYGGGCEYWCGADEPADDPDDWEDDYFYEVGYDPYMGCYSDDC